MSLNGGLPRELEQVFEIVSAPHFAKSTANLGIANALLSAKLHDNFPAEGIGQPSCRP